MGHGYPENALKEAINGQLIARTPYHEEQKWQQILRPVLLPDESYIFQF